MRYLDNIKDMLCDELKEIAENGKITSANLGEIHIITDTIKNIGKIKMQNRYSDGYSESDGYSSRRGRDAMGRFTSRNYSRDGSYDDGMSRDYSRDGSYRRGYSRAEAKESMKDQIEELMQSATNEKEREALQRAMTALHNS